MNNDIETRKVERTGKSTFIYFYKYKLWEDKINNLNELLFNNQIFYLFIFGESNSWF